MKLTKIKWLNILLNILIIVVAPMAFGALLYCYLEYFLVGIIFIPGLIAFIAGGFNNGGK